MRKVAPVVISSVIAAFLVWIALGGDKAVIVGANRGVIEMPAPYEDCEMASPTSTLILSFTTYLPMVSKAPGPLTQTLQTHYLLVENWFQIKEGENCQSSCIDFPMYYFDPVSGVLRVYRAFPAFILGTEDIGFIGRGVGVSTIDGCGGASSRLYKFQEMPFTLDTMTLHTVSLTGTVEVDYEGELVSLQPNEVWIVSQTVSETTTSDGLPCVFTTTHRITNYAFQERDKIIYP